MIRKVNISIVMINRVKIDVVVVNISSVKTQRYLFLEFLFGAISISNFRKSFLILIFPLLPVP